MNGLAEQLEALAKRLDAERSTAGGIGVSFDYALGRRDGCLYAARLLREFIATHEERVTSPELDVEGVPPSIPPKVEN